MGIDADLVDLNVLDVVTKYFDNVLSIHLNFRYPANDVMRLARIVPKETRLTRYIFIVTCLGIE